MYFVSRKHVFLYFLLIRFLEKTQNIDIFTPYNTIYCVTSIRLRLYYYVVFSVKNRYIYTVCIMVIQTNINKKYVK